mmetsp:Transcript_3429/g.6777  ORF Transcript_3429/g.6777 Transcript_3429/m.6777 type:complete len:216 (+) Transcript_3429:69-716(+)
MVRHSSHTPKMAPRRMSLPMRTSTGSAERCTPSGVSDSTPSSPTTSASKSTSSVTARCTAAGSGGSGSLAHTSAAVPGYLSALMRSTSCSSGTRCTSGGWLGSATTSWRCRVMRWKAAPSLQRPARPLRCFALARVTTTSSRLDMRRCGSYLSSFIRPQSITKPTSSIVMAVSAMLVDNTILRIPGGGLTNTRRWSSGGTVLCSGSTHCLACSLW